MANQFFVYNASVMMYSFLMEVMCYFMVLLPLEFDSSIFSFVISAKYNLLKVPVTGFCFVYFFLNVYNIL